MASTLLREKDSGGTLQENAINNADWRLLENGRIIPVSDGYADQPYFLRADDGTLVLICTTGTGAEGERGQHVVSIRSLDDGRSWEAPMPLEPPSDVESSYAVMLKADTGRIYAFYNHNTDDIRKVPGDKEAYPDGWCRRVDSLGYFVFKYSDDHGKTWSDKRHIVPVREFQIDRANTSNGEIRYFWNVGKAFSHHGKGYVPLHKVGGFGVDFFTRSEGVLICSENIMTETDPEKICWQTLPDGDIGIRAPEGGGAIAEEHSFAVLSDDSFFTVFRTVSGYSACSYSRDGGHSWSVADYMRYADGRKIKNSRSANFIWKLSGNRYVYWMNNHSGTSYADRNPIWICVATETDSPNGKILVFSQPEILLYTDDITRRMSYPDLMEMNDGTLLYTETEKELARMHVVPRDFVNKVCSQWTQPPLPEREDVILEWKPQHPPIMKSPPLPVFYDREGGWEMISGEDCRNGFSIELGIKAHAESGLLVDNRNENGRGFSVELTDGNRIRITLNDSRSESSWMSSMDLGADGDSHVVIILDGGPKTISMVVNGQFDDGGDHRQFGFGLFHPAFQSPNAGELEFSRSLSFCRLYRRALLSAECCTLNQQAPVMDEENDIPSTTDKTKIESAVV